jgi:hypothetical protein
MWASLTKRVVSDKPLAASRPGQQVVPATQKKLILADLNFCG